MNILNLSFIKHSIPVLSEKILNSLKFQLSEQQQRIALIVSAIFVTLTACLALFYCISRRNFENTIEAQLNEEQLGQSKTDKIAKKVLISPAKKHSKEDKQETEIKRADLPQEKSTVAPQSAPVKENKNTSDKRVTSLVTKETTFVKSIPIDMPLLEDKKSEKIEEVEETDSTEEYVSEQEEDEIDEEGSELDEVDEDWDLLVGEDDNWESDVDEYLSNIDSSEKSAKRATVQLPKCYVGGKEVSYRTFRCLEILEKNLDPVGKIYGSAIDNGDCFWDAFAKKLSIILKKTITIKELRQKVSEEIHRLDQGPDEENWVRQIMHGDLMDSYEDYRDRVAFTCEEIFTNKLKFFPIWGQEKRDGVILCHLYKVNLRVYSIGCMDEDLNQMGEDDNFYIGEDEFPSSKLPYAQTIEIALYPGHFIPVYDINEKGIEKIEKFIEKF